MHIRLNFCRLLCCTWPTGGLASYFFELFMVNNGSSLIVSTLSSDHRLVIVAPTGQLNKFIKVLRVVGPYM